MKIDDVKTRAFAAADVPLPFPLSPSGGDNRALVQAGYSAGGSEN